MKILNRLARRDYQILQEFEAGIALIGAEVKAIRAGKASIKEAYAKLIGNEIFLINANISVPGKKDYEPTRSRKLLLHKEEINKIKSEIKGKNLTLIPLSMYTKARLIKLKLALAKGKKKHEKRATLRERDIKREIEQELKNN